MKRSKRLAPVVNLATKAADVALVDMGKANAVWLKEKQQLEELQHYKADYLAQFRRESTTVMNAQKALELRSFLGQLDQTIKVQEQQVERAYQQLEKARAAWQQKRSKEQLMQSLVDRYHQEETHIARKQEQQLSDEHSAIQWRYKCN